MESGVCFDFLPLAACPLPLLERGWTFKKTRHDADLSIHLCEKVGLLFMLSFRLEDLPKSNMPATLCCGFHVILGQSLKLRGIIYWRVQSDTIVLFFQI